jgi:glycosyltransferase involved in cell wall biosynthesis
MRDFAAEVTPVILTRDEEANIGRTIAQLMWAKEIIVVDSFSKDSTEAVARMFPNVRFIQREFDDLAAQWTFAFTQSRTPWVLALDADYYVTKGFAAEIRALDPPPNVSAYIASFVYAIRGERLRASLYPPRPVLLRADRCTFVMDGHTQRPRVEGDVAMLSAPIIHDDRKPFPRFIERQRLYMRDEAAKIRRGKNLNLAGYVRKLRVVAPFAVLLETLFVKGLILDGVPGLIYTFERVVAEAILSLELMKRRR